MAPASVLIVALTLLLHGIHAKQFDKFYPFYNGSLTRVNDAPQCHKTYEANILKWGPGDPQVCKDMVDCLMNQNGDINKADWSSAGILLGLTPAILSALGPALERKALLANRRPLLGILRAIGAPSISFTRLWSGENAAAQPNDFWKPKFLMSTDIARSPKMFLISGLQYLFAISAVVNVLHSSFVLGNQTIITWKCTATYLELLWTLLTLVPLVFAMVGVSLKRNRAEEKNNEKGEEKKSLIRRLFHAEVDLCLSRKRASSSKENNYDTLSHHSNTGPSISNTCNWLANCFSAFHTIFGTLVLSSILFIGTLDAFGVLGRFTASALVCHFITAFELQGL